MTPQKIPRSSIACLVLALAGCTLGPDPQRPLTVADQAPGYVHAPPAESTTASDLDPWWTSFGDAATAELVEAALSHNTDLKVAAARVIEAQAALGSARSTLWPTMDVSFAGSRTKNSFTLPEVGRVSVYSTTYAPSLDVSYQLDLFGRLERTRQAAWSDLLAQEAARRTMLHTVVAETVRARTRIGTLQRSLDLAVDVRDSWAATLASIDRRYRSGLVESLDLRLARENLASAEATVVETQQALDSARLALDVLVGRRPGTGRLATGLPALPDLAPVPVGLPADLLDRRPDLIQAEMVLASRTARVGVALAELYPDLRLTASAGTSSETLDDVLSSDATVYNAVLNLLAPIFDGGRRRAEVAASRARVEQAAATYAGAVLQALREVEDALVRDQAVAQRLRFLRQRAEEARAADRIARDRYGRGVATLLQVLETERRMRSSEQALLAAQADAWNGRIDLYLALGGDWLPADQTDDTSEHPDTETARLEQHIPPNDRTALSTIGQTLDE
ncbi:MAG: efflux transporter outer membrane subunit [Thermoanaerobaculia bacterium]|nr:efflux transporter outer membrane subunit [Thermoanaerobaculia bacterium]